MTTTTVPTVPAVRPAAGLAASTAGIARRSLLKFLRTPQLVVVGTLQGALFLLIFRYVFGGAIDAGGLAYVDFLVPGFITTGLLFTGMGAAAGVAEDLEQGFIDRLRSLPIPRSAVLAGRALADTALSLWSLGITSAISFAVGFRLHGGLAGALAAFGLAQTALGILTLLLVVPLWAGLAHQLLAMAVLAWGASLLAAAVPAWQAGRIAPVEALRYE